MKGSSCSRGSEPSGLEAFLWLCPGHPCLSSTVEHQYFDLFICWLFPEPPCWFLISSSAAQTDVFFPKPQTGGCFFCVLSSVFEISSSSFFSLSCCERVTAELWFKLWEYILCPPTLGPPAPSASTHDGLNVKQCLQVGCHLQGLDLCTAMNF